MVLVMLPTADIKSYSVKVDWTDSLLGEGDLELEKCGGDDREVLMSKVLSFGEGNLELKIDGGDDWEVVMSNMSSFKIMGAAADIVGLKWGILDGPAISKLSGWKSESLSVTTSPVTGCGVQPGSLQNQNPHHAKMTIYSNSSEGERAQIIICSK